MKVFSKEKMIQRLTAEGRAYMIDEDALRFMDILDGRNATTNSWRRQVYGEPVLVVIGQDGKTYEVNEADCY